MRSVVFRCELYARVLQQSGGGIGVVCQVGRAYLMSREYIEWMSVASFGYASAARSLAASQRLRKKVLVTARPVPVAGSGSHALHARHGHALPAWWSAAWFARSARARRPQAAVLQSNTEMTSAVSPPIRGQLVPLDDPGLDPRVSALSMVSSTWPSSLPTSWARKRSTR